MQGAQTGVDTLNGYECLKYDYTYKDSNEVIFQRWYAKNLEFVIKQKLTDEDGATTMELFNIDETAPDKMLFEIPEVTKKE